jgi:hypothetical protein
MYKDRDMRLIFCVLSNILFILFFVFEAWIIYLYINSAVLNDWSYFSKTFSVEAPLSGPDKFCLDYCAPNLPLLPGLISLIFFCIGEFLLVWSLVAPKNSNVK